VTNSHTANGASFRFTLRLMFNYFQFRGSAFSKNIVFLGLQSGVQAPAWAPFFDSIVQGENLRRLKDVRGNRAFKWPQVIEMVESSS
jgi:hypothetical protein